MSFISFDNIVKILTKYWDKFLIDGVGYTLLLSAITVFFGAILATLLAGMKMSRIAPLRWLSTAYIEIIRGTPMLLQLYFFYFALPQLIPALNKQKFLCIAIALVCNSAAYVSEVIRSGIKSVDGAERGGAQPRHEQGAVPLARRNAAGAQDHTPRPRQRVYHDNQGHLAGLDLLHRRSYDAVPACQGRDLPADRAAGDSRRDILPADLHPQQAVRTF